MKDYKLSSGKVLTEAEFAEVCDIVHLMDDMEEVAAKIDCGVYDDGEPLYGEIPERFIKDIAKMKVDLELMQSLDSDEAIDEAVLRWANGEYNRLLEKLYTDWVNLPGNEDVTLEEFENSCEMFRSASAMKGIISDEDFEVWQVVVPAAFDEEDFDEDDE